MMKLDATGKDKIRLWGELHNPRVRVQITHAEMNGFFNVRRIFPNAVKLSPTVCQIDAPPLELGKLNELAELDSVYQIVWSHDQRAS
jgi:hypothetical protein